MDYRLNIALFVILFGAGCALGYSCSSKPVVNDTKYDTTFAIVHDTIFYSKPPVSGTGTGKKTKYVYVIDTIQGRIDSIPYYIACVDTIIKTDTISLTYNSLSDLFTWKLRFGAELIDFSRPEKTITITKTITAPRPWYEVPCYVLAGAATGYTIKSTQGK